MRLSSSCSARHPSPSISAHSVPSGGDFDNDIARDLRARLKPLIRKTQPYSKRIAHRGIWVEPELLA
jgi:hypothetical protein